MFGKNKTKVTDITPKEAEGLTRSGQLVLVDVREPDERRDLAPAVRSMHLPVGQITDRMSELPKDQPVAFVCGAGGRSLKAAEAASAAGVDVRNVVGGMTAWEAQGLPVTKGNK